MPRSCRVLSIAFQWRLLVCILCVVSDAVLNDDDSSAQLLFMDESSPPTVWERLAVTFAKWDGVHFASIATRGYESEHQLAFQPLLPAMMRLVAEIVGVSFTPWIGSRARIILAGALISNAASILAALGLYRLGVVVLRDERVAYFGALAFVFSPAAVFMSAVYTEGIFACLSFWLLYFLHMKLGIRVALLLFFATCCRANGWLLSGFVLYRAIQDSASCIKKLNSLQNRSLIDIWARSFVFIALSLAPWLLLQIVFQYQFCRSSSMPLPPYCTAIPFWIPRLFGHVQSKYWGVGLFKYYTVKQIPNFLLAAPVLSISLWGIWSYASYEWKSVLTLNWALSREVKPNSIRPDLGFLSAAVNVYIFYWLGLVFLCFTILHVQVSTRFLSACPAYYWFVAQYCFAPDAPEKSELARTKLEKPFLAQSRFTILSKKNLSRILCGWTIIFTAVGTALFPNFYPWT